MDISTILSMLQDEEGKQGFKDLLRSIVEFGNDFKPEVQSILETVIDAIYPVMVKKTDEMIKGFINLGYSKQEAIIIVLCLKDNVTKSLQLSKK